MAWLGKGAKAGFRDVQALKTSAALHFLRQRPDFQNLIRQLQHMPGESK